MTTESYLTSAPRRDLESECPICPRWVLWCAHFDGRIVILSKTPNDHNCCGGSDALPYNVGIATGFHECSCAGCDHIMAAGDGVYYDSLPAAEAEFERRAEALRLGQGVGG